MIKPRLILKHPREFNEFYFALEREIATVDVNTCIRCIFKKGIFVKKKISNPMIIQKPPEEINGYKF